jgi:dihydropteroate synthase
MQRLVSSIDAEGCDARPNSLGEVQSRGLEVDRLCAILDEHRNVHSSLVYALRRQTGMVA